VASDERILEEIAALRAEIAPLAQAARSMESLKRDLTPRVEEAVRVLIVELSDVESDFQLEDLLVLVKKSMRNVRTFSRALDQLASLLSLVDNLEPLVRQSVPVWIAALESLEQKGLFTVLRGLLQGMEKISAAFGEEDMERMGEGLVVMMGLARNLGEPGAASILSRLTAAPAGVRVDEVREAGPLAIVRALRDPAIRRGIGLMLELTRAIGETSPEAVGNGGRIAGKSDSPA
jgi:uncharacterized protein YjgD (DUF1641 family)